MENSSLMQRATIFFVSRMFSLILQPSKLCINIQYKDLKDFEFLSSVI